MKLSIPLAIQVLIFTLKLHIARGFFVTQIRSPRDLFMMTAMNGRPLASSPEATKASPQTDPDIPPRDPLKLTKLELEFREKIALMSSYSEDDIQSVSNARLRALFEGITASAHDPAVYRAFEVLFSDLLPLRVAGRVMFGRLAETMEEAIETCNQLEMSTGLQRQEIQSCLTILYDLFGSQHVTGSQIRQVQRIAQEECGTSIDFPDHTMISPTELLASLAKVTQRPSEIIRKVKIDRKIHANQDVKRQKHEERYNFMVESFREWESMLPPRPENNRRWDVVHGCFVGAQNPKVVTALRIVYCDYYGLRLAGDVIFSIASSLIPQSKS